MEVANTENTLKKALWDLGLTDRQIASVFNVDTDSVTDWRTSLGLDRNYVEVKDIFNEKNSEDALKKALWELELTDQQIANVFLVNKSNISYWRKKNGLKCNDKRKGSRLEEENKQLRLKLLEENYSDEEIADAVGCSKGTITLWRWKHNISKGKRNSEKVVELSEKETLFLEYLKSKYPERKDAFHIALAKYIEPQVGISPSIKQREFVRKIKVSGFKTIFYFDDGEYTNLNEAMDLFIKENTETVKNIKKLKLEMSPELYKVFLKRKDIALDKYIEPQVGISPSIQQSEFVRKIKVDGFKTVFYFDNGEYTNLNEAMDLFIKENPNIDENITKIKSGMNSELYRVFLERKCFDMRDAQINSDEKIKPSTALDPEQNMTLVKNSDMRDTQIGPYKKISISGTLDPESIEIIDKDWGQESRSAYINQLINTYIKDRSNEL